MRVLPRTIILTKLLRLVVLCSGTFKTQAMEKCGRAKSHPIQCINCNISLTLRRPVQTCYIVLEQDTPIVSLISKWISPLIITEEDCICKACFSLAEQTVNEELKGDNDSCKGSSLRGHKQVCLICGRSLAKTKQTHQILTQTSIHHTEIIQIVQNSISPREIQASDRLCHACFVRVERNAIRNKTLDETRLIEKNKSQDTSPTEEEQTNSVIPINQELPASAAYKSNAVTKWTQTPKPQPAESSSANITLKNYRRAASTGSRCVFYGCDNHVTLHIVSDNLRRTLLVNYKYYVPVRSKVCSVHMKLNMWDSLFDSEKSVSTFTVEQIEHMLSFIDAAKPYLDFSCMASVERIDDHLFQYYMGFSRENFINLVTTNPRIMDAHRGILGLAGVLIKRHTGDSHERISTLLQVPRQTIERKMAMVKQILLDGCAS